VTVAIRPAAGRDVGAAARLHAEINEGFLPTLGPAFLRLLYRRITRWPRSFLLVAVDEGRVVGMATGTEDVGALYRSFLVRDGWLAAVVAAPRLARAVPPVMETLRYPGGEAGPAAELLSLAVDPAARGAGVGRRLAEAVNAEFSRRGVHAARVVAAADNAAALGVYRAVGYRDAERIEVHAGKVSQVLVWEDRGSHPA